MQPNRQTRGVRSQVAPSGVSEQIRKRIEELSGGLRAYNANELVEDSKRLAAEIRDLKTAQIRKLYGAVKSLEMQFKTGPFSRDEVVLLRPKLAYAANKKKDVRPLQEVLDACIGKIREGEEGKADFIRFVDFFEAILAYHRDR